MPHSTIAANSVTDFSVCSDRLIQHTYKRLGINDMTIYYRLHIPVLI